MNVSVHFLGILSEFVGAKRAAFDLPEGARYADLLTAIGRRFGPNMPRQLWNQEENTFNAPIAATRDEKSLAPVGDSELNQDDEIKIFLMAAGG